MTRRTYKVIAYEDKDKINNLIKKGMSKSKISRELGCERKTLDRVFEFLNIDYSFYNKNIIRNCRFCGMSEVETEFYNRGYHCKICWSKNQRDKYSKIQKEYNDYKSKIGCRKCGENRFYMLDFHHIDPKDKSFEISDRQRASFKNKEVQDEIKKCIILCSNCHRELHYLGIKTKDYIINKN